MKPSSLMFRGFFILLSAAYPVESQESRPFQLDCPGPGCPARPYNQPPTWDCPGPGCPPPPGVPMHPAPEPQDVPPPTFRPLGYICLTSFGFAPLTIPAPVGSACSVPSSAGAIPGVVIFSPPTAEPMQPQED